MPEHKVKKPIIGWFCGSQLWSFRNLTEHLAAAMPEYEHRINKCGDLNILLAMDQFAFCDGDKTIILHLDGNRWHEENNF